MRYTGNSQLMKRINRSLLLEAIWSRGPISRAELAKQMRLSPATVSAIVDQLIEEGLVDEKGLGRSQGGRPPVLVTLNPHARTVLALYVHVDGIQGAVTNLHGDVLHQITHPIDLASSDGLLGSIIQAVAKLRAAAQDLGRPVLGIGVACPGLIDKNSGILRYSSSLGVKNVPVGPVVSKRFGMMTLVDNDQNATALAELHLGAGKGTQNFIYISIDGGIGAGIIVDGSVYRGAWGAAGEFGHMTVDVNGPPCRCGNRGCLGVMAGGAAMLSQATYMLHQGVDTALAAACQGDVGKLRIEHFMQAVKENDRTARSIFDVAVEYLGAGVASLVNLLSPELVVVGGSVTREAEQRVVEALQQAVIQRVLPAHRSSVRIVAAQAGPFGGLVGAALLIIHNFRFELRGAV
ncbi:MAG: ROK family transcriptional regulator [Firmicutes bacterium]|nr:ROK family transcriptional regulator [Bacillota bacterium]